MRVLVVEDDPLLGDALRVGLAQRGFSADWTQDGRSALVALGTEPFGAVVLDLGLPKLWRHGGTQAAARRAKRGPGADPHGTRRGCGSRRRPRRRRGRLPGEARRSRRARGAAARAGAPRRRAGGAGARGRTTAAGSRPRTKRRFAAVQSHSRRGSSRCCTSSRARRDACCRRTSSRSVSTAGARSSSRTRSRCTSTTCAGSSRPRRS